MLTNFFNTYFIAYIRKAYLPYRDTTPGDSGTAIGWGQTTDAAEGLANNLNYVTLTSLSNEECQLYYGTQVTENMLCVGGNFNEGTCVVSLYKNSVYYYFKLRFRVIVEAPYHNTLVEPMM